ncbi:XrtA/PEP-CTERM system histidine kinase PrsK [Pontixanthobacter aquaemixtae]|uniref:histidine kinase n=1 Tax=Pontixanthobacter aquaemixtae TaxID=1958940 RepID=A0A844ZTI1_9SPHN|nr:XrtA/PEP-CTERM system histidine kinase PrsK [Pontixanthobacter aquaemixtae]MXO90117.1 PEP-CTERM system histidine kinase PrsK [Pontixanthobacter aquaemixtae]
MPASADIWSLVGFILYLGGAAVCALAAGWTHSRGDKDRPDHDAVVAALGLTAVWCVVTAALSASSPLAIVFETARNLALILALYRLFANDGRDQTLKPMRLVVLVLVGVEILQIGLLFVAINFAITDELSALVFQVSTMFHVMVSVAALALLHSLYVGAAPGFRPMLRWSASGLAAMWAFDLNFYAVAYMAGGLPAELLAIRGLVAATIAIPLAIGSKRSAENIRLRPSRSVAFQSLSLLAIGTYLLVMVGIAKSLTVIGGDFGRLVQVGFTFIATVVALLWLPSQHLRGWVRVTAVKHLFQHRYDYRAEWLRFTQTIGQGDGDSEPLQKRAIKAMADITDSPSGLLLLPGDTGGFELASRWSWQGIDVPADPVHSELAALFEKTGFILDVDEVRVGKAQYSELEELPDWIRDESDVWALIPLLHFDRLTGIIVLARPSDPRQLDWEDFDLFRVVGQQLASYLAEQSGQQALMESARFDEFNRRIAFVMHDIKNLASQLALLARNAERYAENPDFRADMLVTLRNSADKLNALLARLGRYGKGGLEKREPVDLALVATNVASQYAGAHPVSVVRDDSSTILADGEALDQALVHLVQNAIDVSDQDSPVYLDVTSDGVRGRIDIVDSGVGMSAEFVRNGLFKPFVSSKAGGFGIGAFEAREIVRTMGGRLEVESREGLGTRFIISFPLAEVSELLRKPQSQSTDEAA